jgi:hypothetical protein
MRRHLWFLAGLLAISGAALAHHSFAMFDKSKEVTLEGTVKEFHYTNPHSWLHINVADGAGKLTEWSFEMEGPSTLMRAGIKKGTLPIGAKVTVKAWPMKDGRPAGAIVLITRDDGTVLDPRKGFRIPTS